MSISQKSNGNGLGSGQQNIDIGLEPGQEVIEVSGARVHNLKNIDIRIPKNELVVITGISGSGKSSLAFDTIYAEGQRRYMESFGAYARQFIGDMERPDVDKITGLSPVISIEQKTTNKNPRSTVGTVTEIYDFLRLLYARVGEAHSYNTGKRMTKFSEEEIVDNIFKKFKNKKISILAPLVRGRKGHYRELFEDTRKKGYLKVRVDGEVKDLAPKMQVDRYKIHDIEVVVDRLAATEDMKVRLGQSIKKALQLGKDLIFLLLNDDNKVVQYSKQLMCEDTGISYEEPSPNSFSFNSPYGACPTCKGLGVVYQISMDAIMPDPAKSINDGGESVSRQPRFDVNSFQTAIMSGVGLLPFARHHATTCSSVSPFRTRSTTASWVTPRNFTHLRSNPLPTFAWNPSGSVPAARWRILSSMRGTQTIPPAFSYALITVSRRPRSR
jgi:excinuclease ABC subunit A